MSFILGATYKLTNRKSETLADYAVTESNEKVRLHNTFFILPIIEIFGAIVCWPALSSLNAWNLMALCCLPPSLIVRSVVGYTDTGGANQKVVIY